MNGLGAPPGTRRGGSGPVRWVFSSAVDGDFDADGDPDELAERRARLAAYPWTWLRQRHGADVVVVGRPGDGAGAPADGAVSAAPGAVLAVNSADCAPVLLWSTDGGTGPVVGAVHCGWRGLEAGIVDRAADALRSIGAGSVNGVVGPCIAPDHYRFGLEDLTRLALRFGPDVVSSTTDGEPALDLRAMVLSAARTSRITIETEPGGIEDTAASPEWFSWRARRDTARQCSIIWIEP